MCSCIILLGQILVFLVNTVVVLLGLAATGIGVFIKLMGDVINEYFSLLESYIAIEIIVIVLIVAGVVLFLLGIFGCIGATCKVIWSLIVNASGVAILAAGTIYLLIITVQFLAQSKEIFNDVLTGLFNDNKNANGTYQGIEVLLRCCGVNGTDTYVAAGMPIPPTCCTEGGVEMVTLDYDTSIYPNITCHSIGCADRITDYVLEYGTIIRNVLIGIVCFEVATVAFDIIIACSVKKRKYRDHK